MGSNSKLIGIILIVAGGLVFSGCSAVSLFSSFGSEEGSLGGAVLGIVIAILVAIPLEGAGIFLLVRARSESASHVDATRQRKINLSQRHFAVFLACERPQHNHSLPDILRIDR